MQWIVLDILLAIASLCMGIIVSLGLHYMFCSLIFTKNSDVLTKNI